MELCAFLESGFAFLVIDGLSVGMLATVMVSWPLLNSGNAVIPSVVEVREHCACGADTATDSPLAQAYNAG